MKFFEKYVNNIYNFKCHELLRIHLSVENPWASGAPRPLVTTSHWPLVPSTYVLAPVKFRPVSAPARGSTNLLQFLILTTFDSLLCQKGQLILQPCPRIWSVRKGFGHYPQKLKIENSSQNVKVEPFLIQGSFLKLEYLKTEFN